MSMKESMNAWWQQRAPRERQLISWGGIGLFTALSYAYLWQPLSTERIKLRTAQPALRAAAASMSAQAKEAASLRQKTGDALTGPALQAAIQQAANESGLDGKSLQITQPDEHHANISIPSTAFNNWIVLTERLQGKQVRVESCSIETLAEPGMVRVRAVMSAGLK